MEYVEESHPQPTPVSSDVGVPQDQNDVTPQLSYSNGHEWDELKSMLLFQLKQVLSEYKDSRISDEQQKNSLGESYTQLVKSLEEALFSFIEGPPFTLQRLCEVLLNAQTIYPNLSKLALALEKNLLVTSTLTRSMDSSSPNSATSRCFKRAS